MNFKEQSQDVAFDVLLYYFFLSHPNTHTNHTHTHTHTAIITSTESGFNRVAGPQTMAAIIIRAG
jgi:hypothetical protein